MIDICHLSSKFDDHKMILIEMLATYYKKDKNQIKKKIEDTYIDFTSSPEEMNQYIMNQKHGISSKEFVFIKEVIDDYKELDIKSKMMTKELLKGYVEHHFLTRPLEKITKKEPLLSLFFDDQQRECLIDFYSEKYIHLIEEEDTPYNVKKKIQKKIEKMESLREDYFIKTIDPTSVDEFILYRDRLQMNLKTYKAKESIFGQVIKKEIEKKFSVEISSQNLGYFIFSNQFLNIVLIGNEKRKIYHFIKFPILHFLNHQINSMDVGVVHELIHRIETNKENIGITSYFGEKENDILNEARTQLLAIQLTTKLHQEGIFIYDDKNDFKIRGISYYERLFPLIEDFLLTHETFLSSCAIHNERYKLEEEFGPSWSKFSQLTDELFTKYMLYSNINKEIPVNHYKDIYNELKEQMNSYQKRKIIK